MEIRNKETNQEISIKYEKWILNIVNHGIAYEYDILTYPDIVQVNFIQPSGNTVKHSILDREEAMKIIRQYPRQFDYSEIDIKNQILMDINQSTQIKNQSSKSVFSRLSRITRKIRMTKYPKITLTKKPIVDLSILIVGTVAAYAIMKYIFKWF
jgi:hypothetical protein